jgi:valyl-tRNA synthetase
MGLPKKYKPSEVEPRLREFWEEAGIHGFDKDGSGPVYSIDTPPPTVSGRLHLGHTYSYSQIDFLARFWRMNGYRVFFPMGFDDNGLPTERLVERKLGITARQVGRSEFVAKCLEVSEQEEENYRSLWQRLGLSVDWSHTYRTIDRNSRQISQLSFIELYKNGLAYRKDAPTIWCPECRTAIAQAELDDLERETEFITLEFGLADGETLPIATTRPELLPACVAIFVHPDDDRFAHLVGAQAEVPLFGQQVPVLADPGADPEKGTGVVMCCTFGDTADVEWWHKYDLPLRVAIEGDGRLSDGAGEFAGLPVTLARERITLALEETGHITGRQPLMQSVRIHERCDTPVEYLVSRQWFIRVLEHKQALLEAGERVNWHPAHMAARYSSWVENLNYDWCISRQRYFGVPFPVWYCAECGEVRLPAEEQLPIDPLEQLPDGQCECGSAEYIPEKDVMDTWATSSLSPQIGGRWLEDEALYDLVFPMSLRPQAHEIIRTWAFYTIVKSRFHFNKLPWETAAISGWGLAPEGTGKISKSRGGGPMSPEEMLDRYSADAVRYWAASTGLGKDSIISEGKIQAGARLSIKLWNVARFSHKFLDEHGVSEKRPQLAVSDRWILSRLQRLIQQSTEFFRNYDYAAAKSEIEVFFWRDLADNYLEMCKLRLYEEVSSGALWTLHTVLESVLCLFAPFLPYVTEEIYRELFADTKTASVHMTRWPAVDDTLIDEAAERAGEAMVSIATAVRRFKTLNKLHLGEEVGRLQVATENVELSQMLFAAAPGIRSVTRAKRLEITNQLAEGLELIEDDGTIIVGIAIRPQVTPTEGGDHD